MSKMNHELGKVSLAGLWVALFATAVVLAFSGCKSVNFRAGADFEPASLETALQSGQSTSAQVRQVMGKPFGKGRAMMPYHEAQRTVWTYYIEEGSVDAGSGAIMDKRKYLFLFFDGDIFEGYMWFDSQLN